MHKRGDLIEFDGMLAAVLAIAGEPCPDSDGSEFVPEDHVAIWFGDPGAKRTSKGGTGGHVAVIHTVPADLCSIRTIVVARCEH